MVEDNVSQKFRLRKIAETKNCFLEEKEEASKEGLQGFKLYNEYSLILVSTITGPVSSSPFASLIGIHIGIISSGVGLKICAITAVIKKYKLIVKKKRKKHNKMISLA